MKVNELEDIKFKLLLLFTMKRLGYIYPLSTMRTGLRHRCLVTWTATSSLESYRFYYQRHSDIDIITCNSDYKRGLDW
jgi:hypothetical protein